MATVNTSEINGIIDTSRTVYENLNMLATAAGAFLTWDPSEGQWSVIPNAAGTSVKSFNDSNILGEITLSGTGVNELYNSVTINFPHKDLRDAVDTIELTIASADRYPQEIDNNLDISISCINDPVQAQLIATRELKQNRVDKIIEFATNYTANGIRAGDLIDVTSTMYGYVNKVFRVIQIEEQDDDDGNLYFRINALEYDADVYSTAGLSRDYRTNRTGIIPEIQNDEIAVSQDIDVGKQIGRLLAANAALGVINSLFTVDEETGAIVNEGKFADDDIQAAISSVAKPTGGDVTKSASADDVCSGSPVTFSVQHSCDSCFFSNPQFGYEYTITGVSASEVDVPLTGTITTTGTSAGTLVITPTVTTTKTMTVTCDGATTDITVHTTPTQYVVDVVPSPSSITEGSSTTVTITTSGYSDGTTLNYTIGGNGTPKVSSPSLTGTVTINSNTATLTINTTDDGVYDTSKSLNVVVGTSIGSNPCVISNNAANITLTNNETTGPTPPSVSKPGDFECNYVQVPIIWCGTFDADTQYIKSVSVKKYAYLPLAPVGGVAVPTSLTISNPGESSAAISIGSTVNIDPASLGIGGAQFEVITSGFTAAGGGDTTITGTTTILNGYW